MRCRRSPCHEWWTHSTWRVQVGLGQPPGPLGVEGPRAGAARKVISDMLGHSSIQVSPDLYVEVDTRKKRGGRLPRFPSTLPSQRDKMRDR